MVEQRRYTTQLAAGGGVIEETKSLLELWSPGMRSGELYSIALASGRFPTMSARRLRNLVAECFAPRYLIAEGAPARQLKALASTWPNVDLSQLFLIYSSRANLILADFIRELYWPSYESGATTLSNPHARVFVERAIDDGKTIKRWSDKTVERIAGYLTACCADFGLLEAGRRSTRRFLPYRITPPVAAYLAYDLHLAGVGDNALLSHPDWALFGLTREEVLDRLKRLARHGLMIVQSAGEVVRISWTHPTLETLCDVLTEG
ncbi:hypothetical protein CKO25_11205 [Thiocapsa imhoffii]|uniref:DUF1819 family protein n=1 Tax=Thiocapsa imhoffii TaxID=382777 RepID=A0A9X1B9L4_9GAMM|nr:hypothetical protein [Thiocapsa imhoffii]